MTSAICCNEEMVIADNVTRNIRHILNPHHRISVIRVYCDGLILCGYSRAIIIIRVVMGYIKLTTGPDGGGEVNK